MLLNMLKDVYIFQSATLEYLAYVASKEEISTFLFGLDDFFIKVWAHELWHKLNKGRKQSTK